MHPAECKHDSHVTLFTDFHKYLSSLWKSSAQDNNKPDVADRFTIDSETAIVQQLKFMDPGSELHPPKKRRLSEGSKSTYTNFAGSL